MSALTRLLVAALAAYAVLRVAPHAAYYVRVLGSFLAAGIAAAIVRELWALPPHPLREFLPDIFTPLVLGLLMLLAVRAFSHGGVPTPLFPAVSWPLVDLWRPLRRRGNR